MSDLGQTLQKEYNLRFSGIEQYRNQVWKILCSEYFSKFIPADATLLDLGSGWAEFINNVSAGEKFAMDLNPESKDRLNEGIHFLQQDCSASWGVDEASLDVVFTSNFLEHLPDKAHAVKTIAEAHLRLKSGGRIICLGPNIKYLNGSYWDFWDHYVAFTEMSLVELLVMEGFSVELSLPRFLPYSMSTGRTPPLWLLKLYLKLPLFWPLLGKQFLVVARKD